MKLLIITQAVDTNDLALGFFHRWLEEFAKKYKTVEVVCLKEGKHALPENIYAHSLGKPASRLTYVVNFYRYIFSLKYDAVFVHMNEEYMLLGGWWWRLTGKKIVLWRNHKMGSWRTALAARLANVVCYTSPEAFVARYPKARRMPIGIDTEFFAPPIAPAPENTILFLGRLDPVKKVGEFVEAMQAAGGIADIYGNPTLGNETYAAEVKRRAAPLVALGKIVFRPGVPHEQVRELYRLHAIYANLTPSGSFDKTIGEAMASGCIVVCANEALRGVLPDALLCTGTADSAAKSIEYALAMSGQERDSLSKRLRAYVEREHGLASLVDKLVSL